MLSDLLKTIAESLCGADNEAPPVSMYRVHIRMERGPKKNNGFQEQFSTLNYWSISLSSLHSLSSITAKILDE